MPKPREYTIEECREKFLTHVAVMADYWAKLPGLSVEARCEGVAFSLLVALDGGTMALPLFVVTPGPHPDDKEYHFRRGEDWWPSEGDIAGTLHESFHEAVGKFKASKPKGR